MLIFWGCLSILLSTTQSQITSDHQTQCVYNFLVPRGQDPSQPCPTGQQLRLQLLAKINQALSQIQTITTINSQLTSTLTQLMQKEEDVRTRFQQQLEQKRQMNLTLQGLLDQERNLNTQINSYVDGHHRPINPGRPDVYFTTPIVTYVRWGRTQCPGRNRELYTGMATGSYWNHNGGGKEYLCVSTNPQWLKFKANFDFGKSRAQLYGTEYEEDEYFGANKPGYSPIEKQHTGKSTIDNHDVPCVVCEGTNVSQVVVFPGRKRCLTGWRKEYNGFLMAGGYLQSKTANICIDAKPQIQVNGFFNTVESTAYFIEVTCGGALSCPASQSGRELPCVVCSKSI